VGREAARARRARERKQSGWSRAISWIEQGGMRVVVTRSQNSVIDLRTGSNCESRSIQALRDVYVVFALDLTESVARCLQDGRPSLDHPRSSRLHLRVLFHDDRCS
jgi:hypothetical protein